MIGLLLAVHFYTVKPGDTLWGLVGNSWPTVCEQNELKDCNLIYPDEKLWWSNDSQTTSRSRTSIRVHPTHIPRGIPRHISSFAGTLNCAGLEALWESAGGAHWAAFIAAEIAMAESGGQQYATGAAGERGYWQINPVNGTLSTYDAYGNARAAIILSNNGTNWSPWTTYVSGAYAGRCLL